MSLAGVLDDRDVLDDTGDGVRQGYEHGKRHSKDIHTTTNGR